MPPADTRANMVCAAVIPRYNTPMRDYRSFDISPASARAFTVEKGKTVRVIDAGGGQAGDLVAFSVFDLAVYLGQARSRVENRTVRPGAGHILYSATQPPVPLLTITEAGAGALDLLYTPCCRWALRQRFQRDADGCHELLLAALAPWQLETIPDPLNLFFSVTVAEDGGMAIAPSPSRPGDAVAFRAEMDLLLAISTCPVSRGGEGYRVETYR